MRRRHGKHIVGIAIRGFKAVELGAIPTADTLLLKWLHVLSSTFLFGTGIGSAFYMLVTTLGRDVRATAVVARYVVIADWLFTTPAIIIQPVTEVSLRL